MGDHPRLRISIGVTELRPQGPPASDTVTRHETFTSPRGPVSEALEADLRSWVQKHGVVVWLDLDAHYMDFVDALARQREVKKLPYDVFAYRGSHLALMTTLEGVADGIRRPPLVGTSSRRWPPSPMASSEQRFRTCATPASKVT